MYPIKSYRQIATLILESCGESCLSRRSCETFTYYNGTCFLYNQRVAKRYFPNSTCGEKLF